jgi:hypothetical protein
MTEEQFERLQTHDILQRNYKKSAEDAIPSKNPVMIQ